MCKYNKRKTSYTEPKYYKKIVFQYLKNNRNLLTQIINKKEICDRFENCAIFRRDFKFLKNLKFDR